LKLARAGRLLYPASAKWARAFAKRNLVSLGSRSARLRASLGAISLGEIIETHDGAHLPFSLLAGSDAPLLAAMIEMHAGRISDWLLLGDYVGAKRDRSVLFLFTDSRLPSLVVKVRQGGSPTPSLEIESGILRDIRGRIDEQLGRAIPRVVDLFQSSDAEILLLSSLPGQPLELAMQRTLRSSSAFASHLAAAGAWLGKLHRSTRDDAGHVFVHGDFWPRNLLYAGRELTGVVDWEEGSAAGAPEGDLFTLPPLFATDTASWRKDELPKKFRRGFIDETAIASAVRRYLHAYCETSFVPFGDLRAMFERFAKTSEEKSRKEEKGWRTMYPWDELLRMLASSNRSVFSG
jgi:hypothetical protein